MVTDEQGREWVLKKLYNDGWRYIVGADDIYMYLTEKKPLIIDNRYMADGNRYTCIGHISNILPSLKTGDVVDIAEELGIVDWTDVKINTPILVRNFDDERWQKGHFAKYDGGRVFAFPKGRTSFTSGLDWGIAFEQAKIAEVENER